MPLSNESFTTAGAVIGDADQWSVSTSDASFEYFLFGSSTYGYETFDWDTVYDELDDAGTSGFVFTDTSTTGVETFNEGWGLIVSGLGSTEAKTFVDFSADGNSEQFEDFETWATGYDEPPTELLSMMFDAGSTASETFESPNWGTVYADLDTAGTSQRPFVAVSGVVFVTVDYEGFESITDVQEVITINNYVAGGSYTAVVNGEHAWIEADTNEVTTASNLADAINNLSAPVTASPTGATIEISHTNPGEPFILSVIGPVDDPGAISYTQPARTSQWTASGLFYL